jgi:hypothetical protein
VEEDSALTAEAVTDVMVRDEVVALALDFPRVAAHLTGPALRELVRPWLAFATFDKEARHLTFVGGRRSDLFCRPTRRGWMFKSKDEASSCARSISLCRSTLERESVPCCRPSSAPVPSSVCATGD